MTFNNHAFLALALPTLERELSEFLEIKEDLSGLDYHADKFLQYIEEEDSISEVRVKSLQHILKYSNIPEPDSRPIFLVCTEVVEDLFPVSLLTSTQALSVAARAIQQKQEDTAYRLGQAIMNELPRCVYNYFSHTEFDMFYWRDEEKCFAVLFNVFSEEK